jgi:uncharacterized NAD(P)/FAD-binding protein YdhS
MLLSAPSAAARPPLKVVIIGGGASGCLVAANLLRRGRAPLHITLIERRRVFGRGIAYSTSNPLHRLNVPAGRMGAFPDDPAGFLRWLSTQVGQPGVPAEPQAGDFVERRLYGDYLREVLETARREAPFGYRCDKITGEAIDLEEAGDGALVRLADGREFPADCVVLAVGHLPGEYPISAPEFSAFYRTPFYAHLPWLPDVLGGIGPDDDVLLVGAGLTAADLALELLSRGHRGTIHALSRRGLHPLSHAATPEYRPFLRGETLPRTVLATLRRLRTEVRAAVRTGHDWRAVLDAIRAETPLIWQGWSWPERARFMRHLRPFWEVHRHRLAPEIAQRLQTLVSEGRLQYHAGRLSTLRVDSGRAEAVFRRRGTTEMVALHVAKVINCTGPRTDYSKFQHPLFVNLLARGLIDHDPLALGIDTTPEGEVLRYRAGPVGWLYTLGAPLKGVQWESTAIPEIRAQARQLADLIQL